MKRVISSKDTFFYKIILPVFFFVCAAIVPAAIYFYDRNNFVAAVFVFLFLFVSAALLFVMTRKTKKVSVDGDSLYISNYLKEIAVPLSNIDKVLWLGDVRPTIIYLKTDSGFGKKINFYPNIKATSSESNPIVEELKELANIKDRDSSNQPEKLNN